MEFSYQHYLLYVIKRLNNFYKIVLDYELVIN